jgi:hypothetical protein
MYSWEGINLPFDHGIQFAEVAHPSDAAILLRDNECG